MHFGEKRKGDFIKISMSFRLHDCQLNLQKMYNGRKFEIQEIDNIDILVFQIAGYLGLFPDFFCSKYIIRKHNLYHEMIL